MLQDGLSGHLNTWVPMLEFRDYKEASTDGILCQSHT